MTALSECAVEKEGLHGLASRIKLIDSDCWMDRGAARENRTMLLCKGWTHDATRAKLSQRKRRKKQGTKCVCVCAFATWNMHYRNTWVNTRQHCRLSGWRYSGWIDEYWDGRGDRGDPSHSDAEFSKGHKLKPNFGPMRIDWTFCADQYECFPDFGAEVKLQVLKIANGNAPFTESFGAWILIGMY